MFLNLILCIAIAISIYAVMLSIFEITEQITNSEIDLCEIVNLFYLILSTYCMFNILLK